MLILAQADVERLLPMTACIDVMTSALAALARGDALLPLRTVLLVPGTANAFATMPGCLTLPPREATGGPVAAGRAVIGAKVITVFPDNHGSAFDSHQGAVLLFDPGNGSLAAVLDATPVTAIRTAAVSAVATRLLARETASSLAIIGAGVQAHAHLEAMCAVRPIRTLRVWSRTAANARRLADVAREHFGLDASVAGSAAEAVHEAEVVCTTTSAREPVLLGDWLTSGVHVNAIGASQASAREIDSTTVVRSRLYVDRRESALTEPGDLLVPLHDGDIGPEHILGEIGELLTDRAVGRRNADEITLFKSLGLAIEDLAAAAYVYDAATAAGAGVRVALGGARVASR